MRRTGRGYFLIRAKSSGPPLCPGEALKRGTLTHTGHYVSFFSCETGGHHRGFFEMSQYRKQPGPAGSHKECNAKNGLEYFRFLSRFFIGGIVRGLLSVR
jgi:hypothetical protein